MGQWLNGGCHRMPDILETNPIAVPFCPSKFPHGLPWYNNQAPIL